MTQILDQDSQGIAQKHLDSFAPSKEGTLQLKFPWLHYVLVRELKLKPATQTFTHTLDQPSQLKPRRRGEGVEVWSNEGWLKVGRRGWACCWTYRTLGGSSGNRGSRSREDGWGGVGRGGGVQVGGKVSTTCPSRAVVKATKGSTQVAHRFHHFLSGLTSPILLVIKVTAMQFGESMQWTEHSTWNGNGLLNLTTQTGSMIGFGKHNSRTSKGPSGAILVILKDLTGTDAT